MRVAHGQDDPNERHIIFREAPLAEEETPTIAYCSLRKLLGFLEREGWMRAWQEEGNTI